ncbi:hypothetical protein [Xylanimonas sp. McL0601]|uniref:hypothetical protein n=1 Tax=Xylanimonas sp. McL0601 TaxID=3414739 RepID=UPI003CEBBA22
MTRHAALEPHVPPTQELPAVPRHAAPGVHVPPPDSTDGPSAAALVAALVGLVVPLVSVLAILLGSLGASRAARRGTRGRGLARAAVTLGVLELAVTFVVALGAWWVWEAYGDDLRGGLHGVAQVSEQYAALSAQVDRLADGDVGAALDLARELGPDGLVQLAGDAGELQGLADTCRSGDTSACTALLDALPAGLAAGG